MANETISTDKLGIKTDTANQQLDADQIVAEEEAMRRRSVARANDDADASHEGGMGAQGGAVDFGNPKNFGGAQS